jgi:hypothetical protein
MGSPHPRRGAATLSGRGAESTALDRLLDAARAGHSCALVLRGEPGIWGLIDAISIPTTHPRHNQTRETQTACLKQPI